MYRINEFWGCEAAETFVACQNDHDIVKKRRVNEIDLHMMTILQTTVPFSCSTNRGIQV